MILNKIVVLMLNLLLNEIVVISISPIYQHLRVNTGKGADTKTGKRQNTFQQAYHPMSMTMSIA